MIRESGLGNADADNAAALPVGLRRPPRRAGYGGGRCGNLRRGPGRTRDLVALLSAALDTPMILVEDGTRRRVTLRELIAAQLVSRSAEADLRAGRLLVDLAEDIISRGSAPQRPDETDENVVANLLARLGMAE